MSGRVLAVAAVLVGLVSVGALIVRALRAAHLVGSAKEARRRAVIASVGAVIAALAYVFLLQWPESLELRTATTPALGALVGVVLAGLAELTWPRPKGERRQASVTARRGTQARTLKALFLAGLGASGALLAVGLATAGPTGRAVARSWENGVATAGPYPGPLYAVPMGVALAALALGTWWALRMVDARPALDPELEDVDRAIRLAAEMRVLRFACAGALLTAAGLAGTMGVALNGLAQTLRVNWDSAPQPPWDWTQNAGFLLIAVATLSLVAALFALFSPSPSVPAPHVEPSSDPAEVIG